MLKLKLDTGARFELPAAAINIVEERSDGKSGCDIGYDIGEGAADAALSDQYGYVKKQAIDGNGIANPIEMTAVATDGVTHLVTLSRDRILARLEVLDSAIGVNATLTIASGHASFKLHVADTRAQMDGIESRATPARGQKGKPAA
jgi:hypothetical protein